MNGETAFVFHPKTVVWAPISESQDFLLWSDELSEHLVEFISNPTHSDYPFII